MLNTPGLPAHERKGRPSAQTMSTTTTKMMKMKTTTTTTMTTSKVQHAESAVHTHTFLPTLIDAHRVDMDDAIEVD